MTTTTTTTTATNKKKATTKVRGGTGKKVRVTQSAAPTFTPTPTEVRALKVEIDRLRAQIKTLEKYKLAAINANSAMAAMPENVTLTMYGVKTPTESSPHKMLGIALVAAWAVAITAVVVWWL